MSLTSVMAHHVKHKWRCQIAFLITTLMQPWHLCQATMYGWHLELPIACVLCVNTLQLTLQLTVVVQLIFEVISPHARNTFFPVSRQCFWQVLLERIAALEAMTQQAPIVSGSYTPAPFLHLAQPLHQDMAAAMAAALQLGRCICSPMSAFHAVSYASCTYCMS